MKIVGKETMDLFQRIPTGYPNAMYVANSNSLFWKLVKKANCSGDLIINLGTGYFRPNLDDADEVQMVNIYLEKERHRAVSTLYKLGKMQMSVNRETASKEILNLMEGEEE